ncbi:MAG: hypothetical protein KDD10_15370, partial [Phaeodactylibacter sp.]|nr:hypothetical protein [Phaeodactylibacter sp.]
NRFCAFWVDFPFRGFEGRGEAMHKTYCSAVYLFFLAEYGFAVSACRARFDKFSKTGHSKAFALKQNIYYLPYQIFVSTLNKWRLIWKLQHL